MYVAGNRFKLLFNGQDYFPALIDAINLAQQEVFLESYLFEADEVGTAVMEALIAAALRGVRVNVQIDGFGAGHLPLFWQKKLAASGVRVLFFRPEVKILSLDRQRLRRLHRKLAVIDGNVAFIGGINILSDFEPGQPELAPRYDYAVRMVGPLVAQVHESVDHLWRHTAWVQLKQNWAKKSALRPSVMTLGRARGSFLYRDNLRHRRDIEREYLRAILHAKSEIILANAYFLPGYRLRHALIHAAKRGVNVVLLVQGRVDHALLHYASRGFYQQFLSAGIEIYEYQKGFMHAKVAAIDGVWATVGSSNIDPFSLLLAREANVFVREKQFAGELRADLMRALQEDAVQIKKSDVERDRWVYRVLPWLCHAVVRLMMGVSGYGGRRYLE
ncbi:cardiolipin synthase ClsB [Iodobacter fluviatilis]|uniref:Cardiolipin synthase B n=3 Tax=Iodobacter fluviatilis TaxID=537 RepID=A0ABY2CDF5_9NEIS|nr:cardiolipin synthase ClsB [Iodobacter fluviatilis]TCU89632.1 cardiolipin synthase [Iodobacter fluviatilis]